MRRFLLKFFMNIITRRRRSCKPRLPKYLLIIFPVINATLIISTDDTKCAGKYHHPIDIACSFVEGSNAEAPAGGCTQLNDEIKTGAVATPNALPAQ